MTDLDISNPTKYSEIDSYKADLDLINYIIAHDFRTLLRNINTDAMQFIEKHENSVPAEANNLIEKILINAANLEELQQLMLEYIRLGNSSKKKEEVNLNNILEEVRASLAQHIAEKKVHISYDNLPTIIARKKHIHKLFTYLLENSIQYAEQSSCNIHISVTKEDNMWHFVIIDEARPIPEEYHELIFLLFQSINKNKMPNHGVGLAFAKKIVEGHKGAIWVESLLDQGNKFHFTIENGESG